jgi:urease accessory protein
MAAAAVADGAGAGRLCVARHGTRSVVTRALGHSPLRLLTPSNHGHAAWIFTSTYGGGLVGGDAVHLTIDVEPGAVALLQTQASTKIYRSPLGASSALEARVGHDGLLVVLPDPTVCFLGAAYRQDQRVALARGASLVLVDWLTAGRRASGERWLFDSYAARLTIEAQERPVLVDALLLSAADGSIAGRMGRFDCLCTIALFGPAVARHAGRALDALAARPFSPGADLLVSGAPLDGDGCLIRVAGTSVEDVGRAVRAHLDFLPALLGDDPWARKW